MKFKSENIYHYKRKLGPAEKLLLKLFIVLIVLIIISTKLAYSQELIISDYDFTNQNYNYHQVYDFIKSFPKNKLTKNQVRFICNQCEYFEIFPIVAIAWFQKESGLISNPPPEPRYTKILNLCGGYGLSYRKRLYGQKVYKYYSFHVQVLLTIAAMRKYFDNWQSGKSVFVKNLNKKIVPDNAASYSILTLNPYWGENKEFKKVSSGAELFMLLYNGFINKWIAISNKEKK